MANESKAAKVLKKALAKTRNKTVEDGTVVRFVSGGIYTYAAVYVNGRWYLTGTANYFGKSVFTNDEFIDRVLAGCDEVEVATAWESVD